MTRETKLSGANGDREMFIFPVQLTTSRIGSLTRLIHFLLYVMTIHARFCLRNTRVYPILSITQKHIGNTKEVNTNFSRLFVGPKVNPRGISCLRKHPILPFCIILPGRLYYVILCYIMFATASFKVFFSSINKA